MQTVESASSNTSGSSRIKDSSLLQTWRGFSARQRWLLIGIGTLDFFTFCCLSMIGPFFPAEAAKKGMSTVASGFVFSVYSFIVVIVSPVVGKLLPYIGTKFGIISGSFTAAYCCILFGILDSVENELLFAIYCFLVRGVEALGASLYSIAIFALICEHFRGHIGAVLAIGEAILSVGLSAGPAVGSSLYSLGGYKLPFIVTGGIFMVASLSGICYVPADQTYTPKPAPGRKLLTNARVLAGMSLVLTMSIGMGCLYPTLQPHLMACGLSESQAALMFLVDTASSSVFGLFTGALSDRCGRRKWILMVQGVALIGISLVLIGPPRFLPFVENTVFWNIVCLTIHGLGAALALVPSISYFTNEALALGYHDDLSMHSLVSGLWQSIFSLGEVIGPIVGASLSGLYGFPFQSTVVGFFCFFVAALCTLFYSTCGKPQRRVVLVNGGTVGENSPLLDGTPELSQ